MIVSQLKNERAMSDLRNLLSDKLVVPELKASGRDGALCELVERACAGGSVPSGFTSGDVYKYVIDRENEQSTGLGQGIAFPHGRIPKWGDSVITVLGFSSKGIEFHSIDNKPVHAIFLILSSVENPYLILQTMSAISRGIKNVLIPPLNFENIFNALNEKRVNGKTLICAEDIMRPVRHIVTMDTSVEDTARIMHLRQQDVLPVIDENKKLCGKISCLSIFDFGMPDFFKQLSTISFVRHIDPFEKYFRLRSDLKVSDLVIAGINPLRRDNTLLEIIFEITVKKQPQLFVVNSDGTIAGMIDHFSIIDKILVF